MDNIFRPQPQRGTITGELYEEIETVAEKKATAFLEWKTAKINMEKIMALKFLEFKGGVKKLSVAEIEAMVDVDAECCAAKLNEAAKQTDHMRFDDRVMTLRQMLSHRGS